MADGDATTFLANDDPTVTTEDPKPSDQEGEFFQQLVGEGKRYKTPEDVAKAHFHATEFIDQLKSEMREKEAEIEQLKKRKQLEDDLSDKLARLEAAQNDSEVVAPELVERLVEKSLQRNTAKQRAEESKRIAWTKLDEYYGDRASALQAVQEYVGDDTAMKESISQLGIAKPEAFVKLITTEVPKKDPEGVIVSPETPVHNPDVEFSRKVQGLTWSKCRQIKKDDPELYNSREFTMEMHKQAGLNPDFMTT
jgi:hypothetical protein